MIIDKDKWQEIFHTLRKNKLRTGLTAFGVLWGIFMLIIMLGAGKGLENGVSSGMGDFATNSMFIWTQTTTMPYKGFPRNRWFQFKLEDAQAMKDNVPGIRLVSPRVFAGGWNRPQSVIYGSERGGYLVEGITSAVNTADPVDMIYGRFINEFDELGKRKVALLGQKVYEELFKNGQDPIDEYFKINGVYYQVIGVYKSKHTGYHGEQQNTNILIPLSTAQQVYNYANVVHNFLIVGNDNADISVIESDIMTLLAQRHSIHPDDKAAFGRWNAGVQFKKMAGLFIGIKTLVWIVGLGTLLAGVIGVSNIMLIIIKERTQEFGVKRALGATPLKVISSVLSESVFLTSMAGIVGLSLGIYVLELVSKLTQNQEPGRIMFINPEVDLSVAISALVVLIIFGMLAGLIPARRAVSIKPIEAIRTEV